VVEKPIRPLDNIRVVDFSRVLAGPFASQALSDFGAEVVKIENPDGGDDTRAWGPPFVKGESAYFLSANRGKKSVALNLKEERSRKLVRRLIEKSDVVLENFRPGTMDRLGFGYDACRMLNPKIIYCSISGYGQTGPEKDRPGYDLVAQGLSGVMDVTGPAGGDPHKVGTSVADLVAGLYAVQGVLLAVIARERTGKGQMVDVALLDGLISLLTYQAGIFFASGQSPRRRGNQHPTICPYETFRASDGYFNVAVGSERLWETFCGAIEKAELAKDPRFKSNADRVQNRAELTEALEKLFAKRPQADWLALFDRHGVPAGPIYSVGQALGQPQALARAMVLGAEHKKAGKIRMLGIPVKLSETPGLPQGAPPTLGEHTEEIFRRFGDEPPAQV
jgi:crotonobetainyl-CoA:carnitine CoA-transferase CaiB-like acyl-CoA transferase